MKISRVRAVLIITGLLSAVSVVGADAVLKYGFAQEKMASKKV